MSKMMMKKRKTQGNQQLPYIPEEIIEVILRRLSIQSLVRFSCTCKRWCSFIFSDSKFKAHIDLANRPSWILIPEIRYETTIDCDCNVSTTTHPTLMTEAYLRDWVLLGFCNGILLIEGRDSSDPSKQLALWNPYINSFKWIHGVTFPEYYFFMSGLTYDRVNADFKAIVVAVLNNDRVCRPYVFSLRKNSWKNLSSDLSNLNIGKTIWHMGHLGITLDNGICYWKVELEIPESGIICFDPVVEEFKNVPIPDVLRRSTGRLGALDGCLSLIHVCSVWVMKEYGCWTKLFDLGLSYVGRNIYTTYKPIGYNSSKDEVVVLECGINFARFWIADIKKGVVRRPSDDRFSSIDESHNLINNIYSESLMCPWESL